MLTIPKSRYDAFRHNNKSLRWGQAFHQYMKLHKCKQDKYFCDRLYNELDEAKAKNLVKSRLDHNS